MFNFLTQPRIHLISRFGVSGGMATLLHWALMGLLIQWQVDAVIATGAGALAGALLNYILQFHYTFQSVARHQEAIPSYLFSVVFSWICNLVLFAILHSFAGIGAPVAQFLTTAATMLLNLFLYQRFVFHDRSRS